MSGLGALIAGLTETLEELVIDEVTIDGILTSLTRAEEHMPGRKEMKKLHGRAFGTLPAGVELGTHTGKADEYVLDSMVEMLATLGVYVEGVKSFRQGANATDEFTAAQLQRINATIAHGRDVNERQGDR